MTADQFAYWLQGFVELSGDEPPTPAQWKSIREHLALVFKKVTPPLDNRTVPVVGPFDSSKVPAIGLPNTWPEPRTGDLLPPLPTVTC